MGKFDFISNTPMPKIALREKIFCVNPCPDRNFWYETVPGAFLWDYLGGVRPGQDPLRFAYGPA